MTNKEQEAFWIAFVRSRPHSIPDRDLGDEDVHEMHDYNTQLAIHGDETVWDDVNKWWIRKGVVPVLKPEGLD